VLRLLAQMVLAAAAVLVVLVRQAQLQAHRLHAVVVAVEANV
jgi:hypothetical protein